MGHAHRSDPDVRRRGLSDELQILPGPPEPSCLCIPVVSVADGEVGVLSDQFHLCFFSGMVGADSDQLPGRTWGRKGQTPTVARTGNRFGLSAMSTISTRGDLHFTVLRDKFNAEVFIAFLDRLLGQFEEKIHLVVDGHSAHRAKKVREWVAKRPDRIELHFLPAYTPHLNPDELVNADLKRTLADQVITDRAQMERSVRAFFHRIQKLPAHVLDYFQAPHTKYASSTI